jgi:hypothetical protein
LIGAVFCLGLVATCGGGDQGRCCPHPPLDALSGCMFLGGPATRGCVKTCDFWCTTNWRVEVDVQGCEELRFDHRTPAPGENLQCLRPFDAGRDDVSDDAGD